MYNNTLTNILKDEPEYRRRQVLREIYSNLIEDWNLATNLPSNLRKELDKNLSLNINGKIIDSLSRNCLKAVISFDDDVDKNNIFIETVLLKHKDGRNTVCVSSQAGCVMDCSFCKTASTGFMRNLNTFEILAQPLFFSRILKKENKRITNIVFMGMGEPLLNYDNLIEAIKILNDKNCFKIGQRKISVSTSGIPDKIKKLADENLQINLAISVNAPNDRIRLLIMPKAAKYSLENILESVRYFFKKTGRRIMFEYVLLKDINDKEEHATELAKKIKDIECFVNLIPFNGKGIYNRPTVHSINTFKKILIDNGIDVTRRYEFGSDIKAACGQLVLLEKQLDS